MLLTVLCAAAQEFLLPLYSFCGSVLSAPPLLLLHYSPTMDQIFRFQRESTDMKKQSSASTKNTIPTQRHNAG